MKLVPLTPNYDFFDFDCGNDDLNDFLRTDSVPCFDLQIANTFILEEDGRILAYFSLLNDKISRNEISGSQWKKIKKTFPKSKQFSSYPSIKIGRFAVSKDCHGRNIGSDMMDGIKRILKVDQSRSAFRYLTVDAYLSAIPFYEKNGFRLLSKKEEGDETRLMFYDMMEIG